MRKTMMAAAILVGIASNALAGEVDDYYAELVEWSFKPCIAVGAALGVTGFDQESRDLGMKREHVAQLMLAERHKAIRELAETLAGGKKDPTWEQRRGMYPPILRICLKPYLNK